MARRRSLLPDGFADDEPILLEVMEDGYAVGLPYCEEGVDGVKHRKKSCMTIKQTCSFIEAVVAEIEAKRDKKETD